MHGVAGRGRREIPAAHPGFTHEHVEAAAAVLESGVLAGGPEVAAFEDEFARFVGARHAVAVSSGTTALEIALRAHGVAQGTEVVTTPFSFFASTAAILRAGAVPVFADIDENTFLVDTSLFEGLITEATRAALIVDLFGHMADIHAARTIANGRGLALVVDAAQSHGASWRGQMTGSFATTTFSFYATKNLAIGEGGMITTNNDDVAQVCRSLRSHGSTSRYVHDAIGTNARMSEIHGALGRVSLRHLATNNAIRRRNAEALLRGLGDLEGIHLPVTLSDHEHAWHLFTIRVNNGRDSLQAFLNERGISAAVHYPTPIHRQPALAGHETARAPRAELVASQVLSLPVHPGVDDDDVTYMIEAIEAWGGGARE